MIYRYIYRVSHQHVRVQQCKISEGLNKEQQKKKNGSSGVLVHVMHARSNQNAIYICCRAGTAANNIPGICNPACETFSEPSVSLSAFSFLLGNPSSSRRYYIIADPPVCDKRVFIIDAAQ